jgi:hypothetical protein
VRQRRRRPVRFRYVAGGSGRVFTSASSAAVIRRAVEQVTEIAMQFRRLPARGMAWADYLQPPQETYGAGKPSLGY